MAAVLPQRKQNTLYPKTSLGETSLFQHRTPAHPQRLATDAELCAFRPRKRASVHSTAQIINYKLFMLNEKPEGSFLRSCKVCCFHKWRQKLNREVVEVVEACLGARDRQWNTQDETNVSQVPIHGRHSWQLPLRERKIQIENVSNSLTESLTSFSESWRVSDS